MTIKLLQPSERESWDAYVWGHAKGQFFHLSGWQQVIEEAFGHTCYFFYLQQGGKIRGILPLAQIKSWLFGNRLVSLPFTVHAGVLADSDEIAQQLVLHAMALASELKVDNLELRNRRSDQPGWICSHTHDNFSRLLPDSDEDILAGIKKKQRAVVRQSLKNDLLVRFDKSCDDFFDVYSCSVRNLGTPVYPKRYFEILSRVFEQQLDILTVLHQERPVSSVMTFYFKDKIMPYYGGGLEQARGLKSNDFMYYQLMCHGREMGYETFDFGRSKVGSGAHAYKKHWGFSPEPLHYQNLLIKSQELSLISPNNPKYQLMIYLWKHLPLVVSQRLGPFLARDLG